MNFARPSVFPFLGILMATACSGTDSSDASTHAGAATGGAQSSGGTKSTTNGGASLGGMAGAGGATASVGGNSAGAFGIGGASGVAATSTVAGGVAGEGGVSATGGTKALGGSSANGGSTAKGGSSADGGTTTKGGTSATGGSTAAGGTTTKGGSSATGGTTATGGSGGSTPTSYTKPRVINTTDMGADPDDEESLVRQLVMSNEFDLEGLVVATSCWKKSQNSTATIDKIVNAYGQVLPNLNVHAKGFPTVDHLKSITKLGNTAYGMAGVGAGKDSPGSELIIAAADKGDSRPLWVTCWGGCNTLAQAIWKVQTTRSASALQTFLGKLRVFDVLGQDDAGAWMTKTYPDLFFIRATGVYGWQPADSWMDTNVQNHGALGAVYPDRAWAWEGDSPAFLHLVPNGLHNPEKVEQGGWGGRFDANKKGGIRSMQPVTNESQYDTYLMYGNSSEGSSAITKWRPAYDNDFQARMDWTISSNYSGANHHPVAVVNNDTTRNVLELSAAAGSNVNLSAAGSTDPDGNGLVYSWSYYDEPSSYNGSVSIQNASAASATVAVPSGASGKNLHLILTLRDGGTPNLYAYRRVIINVQ